DALEATAFEFRVIRHAQALAMEERGKRLSKSQSKMLAKDTIELRTARSRGYSSLNGPADYESYLAEMFKASFQHGLPPGGLSEEVRRRTEDLSIEVTIKAISTWGLRGSASRSGLSMWVNAARLAQEVGLPIDA